MIKPKVKLITLKQFATQEEINIKTAWSWMIKSGVTPYYIGSSKRENTRGKWSCMVIALDERMVKAMQEMRLS